MLQQKRCIFNDSRCDAIPPLLLPNVPCQWEKCVNTGYWQTPCLTHEWENYPASSCPADSFRATSFWMMHTVFHLRNIYSITMCSQSGVNTRVDGIWQCMPNISNCHDQVLNIHLKSYVKLNCGVAFITEIDLFWMPEFAELKSTYNVKEYWEEEELDHDK